MVPSLVRLPSPWIVSRYLFKLKKPCFVYCRFFLLFMLTTAKNQHQLSISNVAMLCIHVLFVLDCPSCLLMAHSSSFSLMTQQWMLFKRYTVSEARYSVALQLYSYIDPALIKSRPFLKKISKLHNKYGNALLPAIETTVSIDFFRISYKITIVNNSIFRKQSNHHTESILSLDAFPNHRPPQNICA